MPRRRQPSQRVQPATHLGAERGALTLRVRDLQWTRHGRPILDVPDLTLPTTGLVLLLGPSGAGKSSLLKALTGRLHEFEGGHVRGRVEAPLRIGFLPQDARDAFVAHDPLTELQLRLQARGWRHQPARREAERLLDRWDLATRATVALHRLSGGERRRLALLAIQTHDPQLLLLDEPLTHLDDAWRARLVTDIVHASLERLVVIATHEPAPWQDAAERILHLEDGRLTTPTDGHVPPPPRRVATPGPPRLVVEDLLPAHPIDATRPVRLALPHGLHAIIGPNGSGKTTLLHHLAGLEPARAGHAWFDGVDVARLGPAARAERIAVHIQDPGQLFYLPSVRHEVAFQPKNARRPAPELDRAVTEALAQFDLKELADRHPSALSGGQQERVALACTSAAHAGLLLLDEPTQGLDQDGWRRLLELLEAARSKACVVVATHDPRLIARCDTIHRFDDGTLVPRDPPRPLVEVRPRAGSS